MEEEKKPRTIKKSTNTTVQVFNKRRDQFDPPKIVGECIVNQFTSSQQSIEVLSLNNQTIQQQANIEYRSQTGELTIYPKEYIIDNEKDNKRNLITLEHGTSCIADVI